MKNNGLREQEKLKQKLVKTDITRWIFEGEKIKETDQGSDAKCKEDTPCEPLLRVGGVDISFLKGSDEALASLVVLDFRTLKVVYTDFQKVRMINPYIAGFLAFREVDVLANLLGKLRRENPELYPQVTLVDGNGSPTIGIGKNLHSIDGLMRHEVERDFKREVLFPLDHIFLGFSQNIAGIALQTTEKSTKPIYVSIGHGVSLETARQVVTRCSITRIPEPVRQADLRSRELIRSWKS
eukprot:jgi/Bigna1/125534/aug1.1_g242